MLPPQRYLTKGDITQRWMARRGLTPDNSVFVLSRGATEVFPPEDAGIPQQK